MFYFNDAYQIRLGASLKLGVAFGLFLWLLV